MYYRRKIILALIERFGGELKPTAFQKLLLVFTRRQKKPAFEFVPYKFGAFSFQVRADKRTMIKYGQLKDEKNWLFAAEENYIPQLKGMCEKMGIRFMHISELGIESGKRKNLESEKDYETLFKEFKAETLPEREVQLSKLYELFIEYERVAITCFEKEHTSCHRHKISDHLQKQYGVPKEHL